MAIPLHLQQFKAAGIYRVVFDKSTIVNYDTELLRLVVGYSEQGPFNVPVYVKDPQSFVAMFGGINKKLEKRGVFFHRLAIQMLQVSPCLVLNLKKFGNEQVGGATISTEFNLPTDPIETVKLSVEDIYDTTRFWTLDAEKLNGLRSVEGKVMDQYINIATTNTKKTSATVFIRKASGLKVSQYNITVNDWYSDNPSLMPEFLEKYRNSLISDFFAEIYVFRGQFTPKQVLASDTLKDFFLVEDTGEEDDNGNKILELKLRNKVYNAYGDPVDTLDMLYQDSTSNAIGHYVGCLIPEFKNKNNSYMALDILFNTDIDLHNLMMSFNTDLLYEYEDALIDLSGRMHIPSQTGSDSKTVNNPRLTLDKIFKGEATTSVLGNVDSPVIADIITIKTNVIKDGFDEEGNACEVGVIPFKAARNYIGGTLYVKSVNENEINLEQVGTGEQISVQYANLEDGLTTKEIAAKKFGVKFETDDYTDGNFEILNGFGTGWKYSGAYTHGEYDGAPNIHSDNDDQTNPYGENDDCHIAGPERVITSITRLENYDNEKFLRTDLDNNLKVFFMDVQYVTETKYVNKTVADGDSVYGTSMSFIDYADNQWSWKSVGLIDEMVPEEMLVCDDPEAYYDRSLLSILNVGDCLVAKDGIVDYNENELADDEDSYLDAVYVQELGTRYYNENDAAVKAGEKKVGDFYFHYIKVSGQPLIWPVDELPSQQSNKYLVRFDNPLNQEIGTMKPLYLEGYTYEMSKPDGVGMWAKEKWQKNILSTLTAYKGLRTGLLNKSEIDYRYVIDTFASFPDKSIKKELSYLCKEKQSAFCIANFPAVRTFVKCPYASFTDSKGVFNVEYVVKGCNKKKASSVSFSLPDDTEGASFVAYYTPLKFSDGYLDNIVPSAGLVSNLFIEKYMTRQPYYIVAGPNYGRVNASGMVGPDYKYSMDELQIIEPFGVNCMVYRPNFGTFINANQTAKQIPLSALSKVHVRELVIYLMDEVEKVLQSYQWEFNNARTREAILSRANDICSRIMSNGGLQAYLNIMDESNNTPEIIDNEMAVLSTHIEPGMGCGKMVHELTLYRTGQMMSSIAEA